MALIIYHPRWQDREVAAEREKKDFKQCCKNLLLNNDDRLILP
jgi:hypothetical protein